MRGDLGEPPVGFSVFVCSAVPLLRLGALASRFLAVEALFTLFVTVEALSALFLAEEGLRGAATGAVTAGS
jgi:hypothetical protein